MIYSRRIKVEKAEPLVQFFEKNSDIFNDITVTFIDFDEVEVEVLQDMGEVGWIELPQERIDERINQIENHFINIVH